jgi:quercetin dioxygenase-like cupin family protein
MKSRKLKNMKKGWFVGDFARAAYRSKAFEVALKTEKAGQRVKKHTHKVATEITLVVKGKVRFNNRQFKKGDIIIINPKEAADYEVLEDAITVIIKVPSVMHDKYYSKLIGRR